jgi:Domain of unknown function (DUF5658)
MVLQEFLPKMDKFALTSILFTLNLLDAILTIYWVRNGFASEGNHLMAGLLDMGNTPFLLVKIAMGTLTAVVLSRWSDLKIAKLGLGLALGVYVSLMFVHVVTGLSAFGYISAETINKFAAISHEVFAFII